MRTLWFIDDRKDNRDAWREAFELCAPGALELRTFATLAEWEDACASLPAPDAAFVDFFIDGHYGNEAIAVLRRKFGAKPVVIAHSSMPEANDGMRKAGADAALAKLKGVSPSPTILAAFPDFAALEAFLADRIPRE
ncbi:MAG: hypothetical protein KIS92_16250 [Planctomycetota bacterium]|nr:hypothetical protein [Planctomycetota bacterium]